MNESDSRCQKQYNEHYQALKGLYACLQKGLPIILQQSW
jgi:hypothetical protein